jgi:hypothetical protein
MSPNSSEILFYFILFFKFVMEPKLQLWVTRGGPKLGFHPRGSKKWAIIYNNNKMHKDVGAHP